MAGKTNTRKEEELEAFKGAVRTGDAHELRRLLVERPWLRRKVNSPLFAFGGRPINAAARYLAVIDVLLEFGADINRRSAWNKGPFGILDACPPRLARPLMARGARLTAHAAARFGWIKELRAILDKQPRVVHEKGGDGQRPLHFARTPAVAALLLSRGAKIDALCVDHHSSAAQYALRERPAVTRYLLKHGAQPDIFMAARLGDVQLAQHLIAVDPRCVEARIGAERSGPAAHLGIYCWVLGFHLFPMDVALAFGQKKLHALLAAHAPARQQFLGAVMNGQGRLARAVLRAAPSLLASLGDKDHALLPLAVFNRRFAAAKLMLQLGFNPAALGVDGGSALHAAAWVGNPEIVRLLLKRKVDVNGRDPTHGSPPLGWAAYGSVHGGGNSADYVRVIRLLVRAGADVHARGNKLGVRMPDMAAGSPRVQQELRQLELR